MKSSKAQASLGQVWRNGCAARSANAALVMPCSCATRSIFRPCSSVPVRKRVSSPRSRW
jgi:hypothetical protein